MAGDFGFQKQPMFPLITRVNSNFNSLLDLLVTLLDHFRWSKVKMIFDYNPEAAGGVSHLHLVKKPPGNPALAGLAPPYSIHPQHLQEADLVCPQEAATGLIEELVVGEGRHSPNDCVGGLAGGRPLQNFTDCGGGVGNLLSPPLTLPPTLQLESMLLT